MTVPCPDCGRDVEPAVCPRHDTPACPACGHCTATLADALHARTATAPCTEETR